MFNVVFIWITIRRIRQAFKTMSDTGSGR